MGHTDGPVPPRCHHANSPRWETAAFSQRCQTATASPSSPSQEGTEATLSPPSLENQVLSWFFFPPLPKAAGKSGFLLSPWGRSRPGGARPISPLTSSHPSPERCSTAKSSVGSRARAPAPRNSSARPRRPRVPEWHIWLMTHCCHLQLPRRGNGRPSLIERPPTQPPRRGKIAGSRRRGGLRQNEAVAEKNKRVREPKISSSFLVVFNFQGK